VVIPAHRSGAAPAGSSRSDTRSAKPSSTTRLPGVAAVGDAPEMRVGGVVGEGRRALAELLLPFLARGAGAARVDHAAHRRQVAFLEPPDGATRLHHPPDDLVARNAGVDGRHGALPLVPNLVQVGVADPAIEHVQLHVLWPRLAAPYRHRREPRARARGRIGFGLVRLRRRCGTFHQRRLRLAHCRAPPLTPMQLRSCERTGH
jgi:hypothetical protein